MTELVAWLNEERETGRLQPLLLIGIWVAVFLEIHPFRDGNGRLSRVLTTLLLLASGLSSLDRVCAVLQRSDLLLYSLLNILKT